MALLRRGKSSENIIKKQNANNSFLSEKVYNLQRSLDTMVNGREDPRDSERLYGMFNSALNGEVQRLNRSSGGDIESYMSQLLNQNIRYSNMMKTDNMTVSDLFNEDRTQISFLFNKVYENKLLELADINEVAENLFELREAIKISTNAIVTSDNGTGYLSRELKFETITNKDTIDKYMPTIEKVEKRLKLQQNIKSFIVPKTLEFGEYYSINVPHSYMFENFLQKKENDNNFNQYLESGDLFTEAGKDAGKKIYESLRTDEARMYFGDKITGNVKNVADQNAIEDINRIMKHITICNDEIPLPLLDMGIDGFQTYMECVKSTLYTTEETKEDKTNEKESKKDKKKKSIFYAINKAVDDKKIDDGVINEQNLVNGKRNRFSEIKDCHVELADPMHLIPVKLMNFTLGYYKIIENDTVDCVDSLSDTLYSNQYNASLNQTGILNAIADEIIRGFNKDYLKKNKEFKELILNAIEYFNLAKKNIRFQWVPAKFVSKFVVNPDEKGNGRSILQPALFDAKLYLVLQLFVLMSIIQHSNDTRVHYLRTSGLQRDISAACEDIARDIEERQVDILDLFSYTSMVNKIARGSDRIIPVGEEDLRGLETEILQGQDINPQTETLERLKTNYITATNVPAVMLNYLNEADFAKTLEFANVRFTDFVISSQMDFNDAITQYYRSVLKITTSIPHDVIDDLVFVFTPPTINQDQITTQQISDLVTLEDYFVTRYFPNVDEADPAVTYFRKELGRMRMPSLKFDKIDEIYKSALLERTKSELDPSNQQNTDEGM